MCSGPATSTSPCSSVGTVPELRTIRTAIQVSEPGATPLDEFGRPLAEIQDALTEVVRAASRSVPEHRPLIEQAEWNARGVLYHCRRIYDLYHNIVAGVVARTGASPDVIVMHSPEMQHLLFEFYAFMLLSRITLDELKKYVAPTFATSPANLPNSVTDMQKGWTDCPLYASYLADQAHLLRYLLDIRDCLVHHRSFATSDNTVAVRTDVGELGHPESFGPWHEPVTRVTFREVGPDGMAVNILLPDDVFQYDADGHRTRMVGRFTYEEGINLLSQCREFARLTVGAVLTALALLENQRTPLYTWRRRSAGEPL